MKSFLALVLVVISISPVCAQQATVSGNGRLSGDAGMNYPGMWVRQGVVVPITLGAEGTEVAEPTVIYDTSDCQLISSPCFRMWYTGGGRIRYAESADALTWTKQAASLISTARQSFIVKVSSSLYYLYVGSGQHSQGQAGVDLYSSTTGTSFTLLQGGVLNIGDVGTWDHTGLYNISVYRDPVTGIWYMAYEATGAGVSIGYQIGMASSTDGINWTKYSGNPVSGNISIGASGPDIHKVNGEWIVWAHDYYNAGIGNRSDFRRWRPSNGLLSAWNLDVAGNTYMRGSTLDETIQIGDICIIEVIIGGVPKCFMFYTGAETVNGPFVIKCAIFNGTLAQLIRTKERATANSP